MNILKRFPIRIAAALIVVIIVAIFSNKDIFAQSRRNLPNKEILASPKVTQDANGQKGDRCDRDRDGVEAHGCGGFDCDDNDRFRFFGNSEKCEGIIGDGSLAANHDEDCDSDTITRISVSDGDRDGDGYISAECSNPWFSNDHVPLSYDRHLTRVDIDSHLIIGTDCDDNNNSIYPGAQICGGRQDVLVCSPDAPRRSVGWVLPRNGYVGLKCSEGTTCQSQPNGTGICSK